MNRPGRINLLFQAILHLVRTSAALRLAQTQRLDP